MGHTADMSKPSSAPCLDCFFDGNRLVGLVVKESWRVGDPGFDPRFLRVEFSRSRLGRRVFGKRQTCTMSKPSSPCLDCFFNGDRLVGLVVKESWRVGHPGFDARFLSVDLSRSRLGREVFGKRQTCPSHHCRA